LVWRGAGGCCEALSFFLCVFVAESLGKKKNEEKCGEERSGIIYVCKLNIRKEIIIR
jgi:hypothetical protein